jgi:hypothetical protein
MKSISKRALIMCIALFLLAGGCLVLINRYDDIQDELKKAYVSSNSTDITIEDKIVLELRFIEERNQDLAELYKEYDYLSDFDADNFAICGLERKALTAEEMERSVIDFSDSTLADIDFDSDYLFWSVNRKIVELSYSLKGEYAKWIITKPRIMFLEVILSEEYYPDTVF